MIYIFDVNTETHADVEAAMALLRDANPNYLLVGNKADMLSMDKAAQKFTGEDILFISAKEDLHIDRLKKRGW